MTNVTYRPEIDGLRALAVLAVILFHVGFGPFSGGFVGVDVFFVISGYLITALIVADHERGRFSYANFYVRRARRLFPALFVVLVASAVPAIILLPPHLLEEFSNSLIATTFFVANIFFWWQSGYFDTQAIYKPLLHMWSLGVEEQFYLVWPTVLLGLLSLGPWVQRSRFAPYAEWGIPLFLAVVSAISLYRAERTFDNDAAGVFYLAPYRIGEFSIGAALVWMQRLRPDNAVARESLFAVGLALILVPVFLYTEETTFPGLAAMVPCLGAGLIIFAGRTRLLGPLLDNRIAVGIGLISYSLYLVHWPIIVFYQYAAARPLLLAEKWGIVAAAIALATAMYFWVETPFRRPPPRGFAFTSRQVALISAALAAILVVPATYVSATRGMEWRLSKDIAALVQEVGTSARKRQAGIRSNKCHLRVQGQRFEDMAANLDWCNPLHERNIAVIGDSHAADLWLALRGVAGDIGVIQFTGAGCNVWAKHPECRKLRRFAVDYILAHSDRFIGVAVTALMYSAGPADIRRYSTAVADLAETFRQKGIPVVMFGPQARYRPDVPSLIASRGNADGLEDFIAAYQDPTAFDIDRALAASLKPLGVPYVSKLDILCTDGKCPVISPDGRLMVPDYGHWTVSGGRTFAAKLIERYGSLENLFREAGAAEPATQ